MRILNEYYKKGLAAKRLFNHDNSYNPYPSRSREHLLWKIGNADGEYEESDNSSFTEEANSEFLTEEYEIHERE